MINSPTYPAFSRQLAEVSKVDSCGSLFLNVLSGISIVCGVPMFAGAYLAYFGMFIEYVFDPLRSSFIR
jgi:hypothetical protein